MVEDGAPRGQGRRRSAGRVLAVLGIVVLASFVTLYGRLLVAPLSLPDPLQARIEARLSGAMAGGGMEGTVAVGDMVLALPSVAGAPALEFRDVVMTTAQGEVGAVFPNLRMRLAAGPLLRGQARIQRIVISGAGVNMTRDVEGRLSLDFAGATPDEAGERTVAETLARLDAMFARARFSHLREILGVDIGVTLLDAETGREMRLHRAEVQLARAGGQISLDIAGQLAGSREASVSLSLSRDAGRGETDVSMAFDTLAARDLAGTSAALAWLDLMRAPIDGELSGVMGDDGTLGAMTAWLEVGAGEVTLPGQEAPLPFNAMAARLNYAPQARRIAFESLTIAADQLSFQADGHADVTADGSVFTGQFTLRDISAHPEGLFAAPLEIDGAALDLRLSLGEQVMIEVGQATLYDDALRATVSARAVAAPAGLSLAVDARLGEVDAATVLSYWPQTAIPNTRWWVEERLLAATARGGNFALRWAPDTAPRFDLSFDFTDADVVALPAAPPILGASGFVSLQNEHLSVAFDGGAVGVEGQGTVALAGSRMQIADVSVTEPLAEFDLNLAGAVPDLMHVLAGPPFQVLEVSGFAPADLGTGQIAATARVATRLVEQTEQTGLEGVDITANGVVTGFRADALIPDRTLTSDRITVTMTPEQLSVGGRAALDGVPVTGLWSVQLDPEAPPGSLVEARATLDRAALATFGVVLPDWLISGRGQADVTVFLQSDEPAVLRVRSDLEGIALAIPPLAWRMPANRTGDFAADIVLGPRPAVRSLRLEGGGLSLEGAVTFTADGYLNRFSAGRFRVGQWLDVQGGLVGRGAAAPGIEVSGGVIDFRTMPSLSDTGGSGSGDIGALNVTLDRMQITEGIALTGLRAALDGASMSGEFRGQVNGDAAVNGQLVPSANGPSVRLQSRDGGAVLRAADIFENMHGGAFDLILAARPEAGQYDGRLTIDGARLRDAPVMAELLNLISVVGLLEQLSGDGINLGEINGAFRITPEAITVQEGTALGPAMGFSMDGVYDVASQRYEMQGVVSPLYIVNGLFGALFAPRREGLFGFNYRLIGDSEDTRVSVNPLSILTPGIFREIFRAPPPDFTQ